jgi:PAS domain S-box-containing protein
VRRTGIAQRFDGVPLRVHRANGRVASDGWIDAALIPLPDADGNVDRIMFFAVDVTAREVQRRRVGEAAARNRRQLTEILHASSELIAIVDPTGPGLVLNDAGCRLVGLDGPAAAAETPWTSLFFDEDLDLVTRVLAAAARDGRWTGSELDGRALRLRNRQTGAAIPVAWECFRLDDAGEQVAPTVGWVMRDLRPELDAERVRQAERRRREEILERITDAFYTVDEDFRLTYVNPRGYELLGMLKGRPLTSEDLIGKHLWDEFPSSRHQPTFEKVLRTNIPIATQYRYPEPDGPWFDVHLFPSDGGLAVYFRDISEQKAAEAQRERRAFHHAIVTELGQRATTAELPRLFDDAVALVAATIGADAVAIGELISDDELFITAGVGAGPDVIGHVVDPAGPGSQAAFTLGRAAPVIIEDLRAERRFEPSPVCRQLGVLSSVNVVIDGSEGPYGVLRACARRPGAFTDVEATFLHGVAQVLASAIGRTRDAERLDAVREAERARVARDLHDEALQELAAVVALTGLDGTGSAEERLAQLGPALRRVREQVHAAIYDLRLGHEGDRPFRALLHELVGLHRERAVDCEITLERPADAPAVPLGELGTQVLRLLGEALTNARRHADAAHVRVRVSAAGGRLVAEVRDDGSGAAPRPVRRAGGRGTGIAGMHERAQLLGGRLEIDARPGKGTTVRLDVPWGPVARPAGEAVRTRVLIVDDNAAVREVLSDALGREAGLEIAGLAATLEQARGMVDRVDIALLDLELPDGYGPDLIPDLHTASPGAQAIVLAMGMAPEESARLMGVGAARVMDKVSELHSVCEAVRLLAEPRPLRLADLGRSRR